MRRSSARAVVAGVATLSVVLTGMTLTGPASATTATSVVGPLGSCTTSKGALVAVSFGPWSGPVVRGCGTTLSTGRALLKSGGFTTTDVARFPGFICRIGNPLFAKGAQYPTSTQDKCINTPPANSYWSFWTAAKGVNTWKYSSKGADSDVPTKGEVEAWTYGATDISGTTGQPKFTPNQIRAGLPAAVPGAARAAARPAVVRPAAAASSTPDVAGGAAYLIQHLAGGTHFTTGGQPDIGLTIDGAYALAAAGQDAALGKLVAYVAKNQNSYTFLTGPYKDYAGGGYVGKVALLAEVAGENPRSFGGVDLVAGMDRLICTKADQANGCVAAGNYVYTSSTFGQALGVIAQVRAADTAKAAKAITYLESLQHGNGAFPSVLPGTDSDVDSTAVAAMALALVNTTKARTALAKALTWLAGKQLSGGGFPGAAGTSTNSAALAIQALSLDARTYRAQLAKGEQFLAAEQNSDGGFDVATTSQGSDLRASTQALSGAVGVPFGSVLDNLAAKSAAKSGADYLVSQLVDGDHYNFAGSTFADQGLTSDALYALVSTGGHASTVAAIGAYLAAHVDDYADVSGNFGGPYSGSLAKLALDAESTGKDPHAFGGYDLLKLLVDHECSAATADGACTAKGDFGNAFSGVSQALGVLALQASPVTADHLSATSAPVVRLHQLQCADGGFTSTLIVPGASCTSDVDTTGYAVQALAAVRRTDTWLAKAQAYLQGKQRSSGLFPGAAADNSNSTALAAQALQTLVTSLYSPTTDVRGPKSTTPIVAWQSALRGLVTLSVSSGGFAVTSGGAADVRASTQAVAAASQRTLLTISGATISSAPRGAETPAGAVSASSASPSSGIDASSIAASGAGGGAGVNAAATANTGVPTGSLLGWAALLLLLGSGLTLAGRRRVAAAVGRHSAGGQQGLRRH